MGWTPEQLTQALHEATNIKKDVQQVIKKGAHNIKRDATAFANFNNPVHAPGYPRSIGYEVKDGGMAAEIEPQSGMGVMGAILELGGVRNAPQNNLGQALEKEEPNVQKYLEQVVTRALW